YSLRDFQVLQLFTRHLEVALEHQRTVSAVSTLNESWHSLNLEMAPIDHWKHIDDNNPFNEWYQGSIRKQLKWITEQLYATTTTLAIKSYDLIQFFSSDETQAIPALFNDDNAVEALFSIEENLWLTDANKLTDVIRDRVHPKWNKLNTALEMDDAQSIAIIPLDLMKESQGILFISYEQSPQLFDNFQRSILISVATFLNSAIRHYDAIQQR